jgi:hypothetical protein
VQTPAQILPLNAWMFLTLGVGAGENSAGGGGSSDAGTALGEYFFTVTTATTSGTGQFTTTVQPPVLVK